LKNLKEIDVASSLYYLHRDLPSDAAFLPAEPRPAPEPQIARKPLREVSPLSIAEKEKRDLAALQLLNQTRDSYLAETSTPAESVPQRSPAPSLKDPRPSTENATPPPRRPLGPRPLSIGPPATQSLSPSPYNKENTPFSSPHPSTATSLARLRANSLLTIPLPPPPDKTYTLTLIRRDPISGGQWNIGTISGPCRPRTSSAPHSPDPISIHLTTAGYNQFSPTPLRGFHREVRTEYSGFWDHALKKHRRGSSSAPHPGHLRTASEPTIRAAPSSPTKKAGVKFYTLLSPWNGRCEFSTGAGGRSLRCRHTPASPSASASDAQEPALVSELRYNLPSGQLFHVPAPAATAFKRSSRMAGWPLPRPRRPSREASAEPPALPPRPPRSSVCASEDEEGLDLSLGRERAGGGNRGGRAKLGKLIVYDEGLKMMDLCVAGNMGIWWEGWER